MGSRAMVTTSLRCEAVDGSQSAIRQRICDSVVSECAPLHAGLRSIILTGSLARDEASFVYRDCGYVGLGDAEFLLVFKGSRHQPPADVMQSLKTRVEHRLANDHHIRCNIDLGPVDAIYLRRLPPHIFTYELKQCGRPIWGDEQILSEIPDFRVDDLSRIDAFRTLCNRLTELLESALGESLRAYGPDLQYRLNKLYLDMATSLLVFTKSYAASYRERNRKVHDLADRLTPAIVGLDLARFADRVDLSTRRKLCPQAESEKSEMLELPEAIEIAHQLWRWELIQLAGTHLEMSDRHLFRHWSAAEPLPKRIRGWAYVLRACGWHRSYRNWVHWARLARRMSPRTAVYSAASILVFEHLACFGARNERSEEAQQLLRNILPVVPDAIWAQNDPSWSSAAAAVVWNYKTFLERTRS